MEWKDWQIIDRIDDNEELPAYPSEMWIINCFYFILKDNTGRRFLPLVFPAYSYDREMQKIKIGMWSTPYTALRINDDNPSRTVSVAKIKRIYSDYIINNEKRIKESINYFFYYLGVSDETHDEKPFIDFIEYKRSFSQSNVFKCYLIRNFYVYNLSKSSKINIMDPDNLKGLYYLDLSHIESMKYDKERQFLYYQGRVLSSNSTYILKNNLLDYSKTIPIDCEEAIYNEFGYVFMYDLNASGSLRNNIEDSFLSFLQDGTELAEEFLSRITIEMTDTFNIFNIVEYKLEGDGFIASIPINGTRCIYNDENALSIIQQICLTINNRINMLLEKSKRRVSAKVTICRGDYRYGKIGGLTSLYSSYSGKILFSISRLQSALATYLHSEQNFSRKSLYITSDEKEVKLSSLEGIELLRKDFSTNEKESKLSIDVYGCE